MLRPFVSVSEHWTRTETRELQYAMQLPTTKRPLDSTLGRATQRSIRTAREELEMVQSAADKQGTTISIPTAYGYLEASPRPKRPTREVEKSKSVPDKQGIPNGWLRITNRAAGVVLGGEENLWRVEQTGNSYKLWNQNKGQYAGLAQWTKERDDGKTNKGIPPPVLPIRLGRGRLLHALADRASRRRVLDNQQPRK